MKLNNTLSTRSSPCTPTQPFFSVPLSTNAETTLWKDDVISTVLSNGRLIRIVDVRPRVDAAILLRGVRRGRRWGIGPFMWGAWGGEGGEGRGGRGGEGGEWKGGR
jgi:hypothetical protein